MSKASKPHDPDEALRLQVQSKTTWGERLVWAGCAVGFIAIILIVSIVSWSIHISLDAERNLHATRFVIRLVEKFVKNNGRWPATWQELEALKPPDHLQSEQLSTMFGPWPGCAEEVRKQVTINFQADVEDIVGRDRMVFDVIKPAGRHYEYRDYGDVDELQRTLRQYLPGLK
jgi:hypothetical protein